MDFNFESLRKDAQSAVQLNDVPARPGPDEVTPQDDDADVLARLGKKQVTQRNFSFLSIVAFSCAILITWQGSTVTYGTALNSGGLGALVYQFIIVWVGMFSTFLSIGECVSIAPTAGGQYHWTALFAPHFMRSYLSYMTGWMTIFSWIIITSANAYLNMGVLQGLISLAYPDYDPKAWHLLLMSWAFLTAALFFATIVSKKLPLVEIFFLLCNILGLFGLLVPLVYLSPSQSAQDAFATGVNSGYPTYGLSFMTGIVNATIAFVGADAAVHMAEEIKNPLRSVPVSITVSILINGALGFGITVALVFSSVDYANVADYTEQYGYPFIGVFQLVFNSTAATVGLGALIVLIGFSSTLATFVTSSRMVWSFARDRGLPFSNTLQKISPTAKIPLWSIAVCFVIPVLLQLIGLGSSVVLDDFLSLPAVGFYSTYLIALVLLLYRRLKGDILEPHDAKPGVVYNKETESFVLIWGPWRLKGWLGIANNIFSIIYLFIVWFFAFWPPATPVTASTMTYSCAVWGAAVIFSTVYYIIWGRRQYKGPIVEVTVPNY